MGRDLPVHPLINRNTHTMKDTLTLWLEDMMSSQVGKRVEIPVSDEAYEKHKAEQRRVKCINPTKR
jgi:hypothetical protein